MAGNPMREVMHIIAHRGASHDAPENTIPAFQLAWQQGADGIEGDFHLTRDGEIVCIHDASTKRTTQKDLKVAQATLAELRKLDAGSWKSPQWANTRIPTLAEVLSTIPAGGKIYLEVKCGPGILPGMARSLARFRLKPEQVIVMSFDTTVVAEARRQLPPVTTLWLTEFKTDKSTGTVTPSIADILVTLKAIQADGVDCHASPVVDDAWARALRAANKQVHVWTVDDVPTAIRFRNLGIDSLTSNRAGWLKPQLFKYSNTTAH